MHSFLSYLLSVHLLIFSAASSFLPSNLLYTQESPTAETEAQTPSQDANAPADENALGVSVTAPGAVLMEATTGAVIFEKDSKTARHPASITKIMTLILIFEALEKGSIHLTDTVTVSEHAASMGGSQVFLEAGETQDVETMIKCISIASANDACVAYRYSRHYSA